MAQNRPTSASGKNDFLSVPERARFLTVEQLSQKSGLSALLHCTTDKTESSQQTNEKVVTITYFNTKCDTIADSEPLLKATDSTHAYRDIPETQMPTPATSRSGGDALLPLVMATAAVPVATSYMQALKSKLVIAAGLTGLTLAGKLLWDRLSPDNSEEKHVNRTDNKESLEDSFDHLSFRSMDRSPLQRENHRVKKLLCREGRLPKKGKVIKENCFMQCQFIFSTARIRIC